MCPVQVKVQQATILRKQPQVAILSTLSNVTLNDQYHSVSQPVSEVAVEPVYVLL